MRADAQKEKHKRMYPFAKDTFVSKKRRAKENKAKAKKRRHDRSQRNCERVLTAITHSSSHSDIINSNDCSMMGVKSLAKRDARWLKILSSQGKFEVDAIKSIKGNVSPVVKGAIDDSVDDDDYEEVEVEVEEEEEEEEEDGNASRSDDNGKDDKR